MKRFLIIILTAAVFISVPFLTSFLLGQADTKEYITVNDAGKTLRIKRGDFLLSAVLSVADEDFEDETLKALSTVFSTLISYGEIDADSERGVLLIDTKSVSDELRNRASAAIEAAGENVILYDGKPIYSVYHKSSGGNTLESESVFGIDYPYLCSVSSDETKGEQIFSKSDLKERLGLSSPFSITRLNDDNSVGLVLAGDISFTGAEFREKIGIMGSVFSLLEDEENLYVSYKGEGHGVGLSLMGADKMAKEGKTAEEILTYYYQNAEIAKIL